MDLSKFLFPIVPYFGVLFYFWDIEIGICMNLDVKNFYMQEFNHFGHSQNLTFIGIIKVIILY